MHCLYALFWHALIMRSYPYQIKNIKYIYYMNCTANILELFIRVMPHFHPSAPSQTRNTAAMSAQCTRVWKPQASQSQVEMNDRT